LGERWLLIEADVTVLAVGKIGLVQVSTMNVSVHRIEARCVLDRSYPLIMTSSSAPYILACHVPQPSLKRGGTKWDNKPRSFGLRKSETCTLSGCLCSNGRRISAVDEGPGRVDRLRSSTKYTCSEGCVVRAVCSASIYPDLNLVRRDRARSVKA
jgi:hypothetical protein